MLFQNNTVANIFFDLDVIQYVMCPERHQKYYSKVDRRPIQGHSDSFRPGPRTVRFEGLVLRSGECDPVRFSAGITILIFRYMRRVRHHLQTDRESSCFRFYLPRCARLETWVDTIQSARPVYCHPTQNPGFIMETKAKHPVAVAVRQFASRYDRYCDLGGCPSLALRIFTKSFFSCLNNSATSSVDASQ